jgi:hypothetical protein
MRSIDSARLSAVAAMADLTVDELLGLADVDAAQREAAKGGLPVWDSTLARVCATVGDKRAALTRAGEPLPTRAEVAAEIAKAQGRKTKGGLRGRTD